MSIPRYYELFYSFLEALRDGQKHKLSEITGYCADKFNLTEEEKNARYTGGKNIFNDNVVGVARTYLKKAGLISSPEQATFQITELGQQTLQREPETITLEYVRQLMNDNGENESYDITITDSPDQTQSPSDSKISTPEIQKFLGALAGKGATKGLFITTGQFTQGARDFVKKQLNHKIVLIDGKELANYMIEYNLGVTTVTTYAIKRIDSDYFAIDN